MILAGILDISINLLLVLQVIVCLMISLLVLMQRPKNEGLGAAFGSGMTDSVWGAQTTNVLQKGTVYFGILFFVVTLILGILIGHRDKNPNIVGDLKAAPAVAAPAVEEESIETESVDLAAQLEAQEAALQAEAETVAPESTRETETSESASEEAVAPPVVEEPAIEEPAPAVEVAEPEVPAVETQPGAEPATEDVEDAQVPAPEQDVSAPEIVEETDATEDAE